MSPHPRWATLVAVSTAVLVGLVLAGGGGPLRVAATMWFLLACPGVALVPLLRPRGAGEALALVPAVSLAAGTLVATGMLVLGAYSSGRGLAVLVAVCAAGCALQLRGWARARPYARLRVFAP